MKVNTMAEAVWLTEATRQFVHLPSGFSKPLGSSVGVPDRRRIWTSSSRKNTTLDNARRQGSNDPHTLPAS